MDEIHRTGVVDSTEFTEAGTEVRGRVPPALAQRLQPLRLGGGVAAAAVMADSSRGNGSGGAAKQQQQQQEQQEVGQAEL